MSWFRPCLHESLRKTVKWHGVPVLSRRWWITVHHVEEAVIIQLTLKWSHSGIACSRDVLGHLKSYGISSDEAIISALKLLLARSGILFTFKLFCAALLNYATDLFRGPQALFSTCTNPIIHLFYPPKICIGVVLDYSWDMFMSQEKL